MRGTGGAGCSLRKRNGHGESRVMEDHFHLPGFHLRTHYHENKVVTFRETLHLHTPIIGNVSSVPFAGAKQKPHRSVFRRPFAFRRKRESARASCWDEMGWDG